MAKYKKYVLKPFAGVFWPSFPHTKAGEAFIREGAIVRINK